MAKLTLAGLVALSSLTSGPAVQAHDAFHDGFGHGCHMTTTFHCHPSSKPEKPVVKSSGYSLTAAMDQFAWEYGITRGIEGFESHSATVREVNRELDRMGYPRVPAHWPGVIRNCVEQHNDPYCYDW